jgi:predicted Zn-ribbon and HTH transcriptional regulator
MGLDCLIPTTNALRFFQTSLNVQTNMIQQNGELLPQRDSAKRKGNYTGERLKVLRPETYRRVVQLLAEPREHVSIREICRQCHVTDDTVKAIERREAVSIAARKEALMVQAARIAKLAYDRVEDQIDSAPLPQAVVTAGVFTDKLQLLSGDATAHAFNLNVKMERVDLAERFNWLVAEVEAKVKEIKEARKNENASVMQKQLALPSGDTIADSGAETGLQAEQQNT